jgi:hypothetical protein
MGPAGITWVGGHPGYGAYAITADRHAAWTRLIDGLLIRG